MELLQDQAFNNKMILLFVDPRIYSYYLTIQTLKRINNYKLIIYKKKKKFKNKNIVLKTYKNLFFKATMSKK